MVPTLRDLRIAAALLALGVAWAGTSRVEATEPDAAEHSMRQFLAQGDTVRPYRATRHLEAQHGRRSGWLDAMTEYSPEAGFRYQITDEGGSSSIRADVLRAVLEGERDAVARGDTARASLVPTNYTFRANGIDVDGLANVLLSPRRKERMLVSGMLALNPADGGLVRLQGRLARSPSFWLKSVDIVRSYRRFGSAVVPVALQSTAQVRFLGEGTMRMTYEYLEIDGHPVRPDS
jgi:hypothetical protein